MRPGWLTVAPVSKVLISSRDLRLLTHRLPTRLVLVFLTVKDFLPVSPSPTLPLTRFADITTVFRLRVSSPRVLLKQKSFSPSFFVFLRIFPPGFLVHEDVTSTDVYCCTYWEDVGK